MEAIRETQIYNFDPITRGDTFLPMSFEFYNNIGTEKNPILEPISIASFKWHVKARGSHTKATEFLGRSEGHIIFLDKIDRFDIPSRAYVYDHDCEITEEDGTVFTYLKGTLKVIQDVSNS